MDARVRVGAGTLALTSVFVMNVCTVAKGFVMCIPDCNGASAIEPNVTFSPMCAGGTTRSEVKMKKEKRKMPAITGLRLFIGMMLPTPFFGS